MSVIAWDGETLAADRQGTSAGMRHAVKKIYKINDELIGITGSFDNGIALLNWYKDPDNYPFPECQKTEDYSGLLIIEKDGSIWVVHKQPFKLQFFSKFHAVGAGRDFAMAAMYLGSSSTEAVRIASIYETSCGMGVDSLTFD